MAEVIKIGGRIQWLFLTAETMQQGTAVFLVMKSPLKAGKEMWVGDRAERAHPEATGSAVKNGNKQDTE